MDRQLLCKTKYAKVDRQTTSGTGFEDGVWDGGLVEAEEEQAFENEIDEGLEDYDEHVKTTWDRVGK
jgi:hypothetical protein